MRFILEPDGTITLLGTDGQTTRDVRFRRAFPWSKPRQYISVRDEKGKEQTMIRSLDELEESERTIVETWLDQNSFIPLIRRVEKVNTDFGYQEWQVETDRGKVTFRVQEREDIRFLPDGRFSIKDADGNIYAMPRLSDLDPMSLKAVEPVL
ncbi:MAG: hypothetical protein KatS3mg104_0508 [Phycisphaerae bacterium]|jgi:hypothetical protein|nr:MAG: hypothetical protein KatS3mg104_0508 [Phycisphaerae bacterium]